ncbi:MAG: succinate--CoA ligase subunit alpha [Thermoplasmatota archaeon]|nr:succinate--CoA ligase subunit alpha [Candidatus Thermoplasmatota archaeon]MBU1914602.1 succinate--CoA ligase subunit alpha [Candidatus Thermoplasmatota archaeon]
MAIIVDDSTKLVVQGITGYQGSYHSKAMMDFGTKVVAGTSPGKAGEKVNNIPVFDSVSEAIETTGANTSCMFVPAPFCKDAALEAIDAGIRTLVVVTEHLPVLDAIHFVSVARSRGITVIGPNCPGIASPGKAKVGILPNNIFKKGNIGVVSKSGTLTYEIVNSITEHGLGQSTCVGIGGDRVSGTSFIDILERFEADNQTKQIVLVGEIGGTAEEEAAEYIKENIDKPVVAYIAGRTAPPGKRMGHAGAIIARGRGTAESKIRALEAAGVKVAKIPTDVPELLT